METLNTSSPRKRGSSNPLILDRLDSRFRGNDRVTQSLLISILLFLLVIAAAPLPAAVTLESFTFPTKAEAPADRPAAEAPVLAAQR